MQTPNPIFGTVVIAGLGLIGGSVALGLRERFLAQEIIGYDLEPSVLSEALGMGVIDRAELQLGAWLKNADLVVLAVPVRVLPKLAREIAQFAGQNTIFTDVGSVKGALLESLIELPLEYKQRFVAGHPMAGSEKGGVKNASAALLQNAIWVLTPSQESSDTALAKVRQFVELLGAKPVVLDARAHDRLVAMVSHLPYLSALALTRLVARHEDRDGLALLAAGGFRDLTRVASGDPTMSRDMVVENRAALREALSRYRAELESLEAMLFAPEMLLEAALEGKRTRDSLPVVKRSLLPVLYDVVVALTDRPGEFARVATLLGGVNLNIKDVEVLTNREQGGSMRLGFATLEEAVLARQTLAQAGFAARSRF
ncbi:MAG: prephenate dehydrogenase/arogenate dehydrogenase family protein [Deinococcales bacterium]